MNRILNLKYYFLILLVCFGLNSVVAQTTEDIVKGSAVVSYDSYNAGEEFQVVLNLEIEKDWYFYDLIYRTSEEGIGPQETQFFEPEDAAYEIVGDIVAPEAIMEFDEGFKMDVGKYKESVSFTITAKAIKSINLNQETTIGGYIQVCKDGKCLIPTEVFFKITAQERRNPDEIIDSKSTDDKSSTEKLTDDDQKSTADTIDTDEQVKSSSESEIEQAKKDGAWSYFFLAMSFGALALLTPCVFPMIPITVSFFTKRSESEKSSPVLDAALFALGIIGTFVAIGLVTSALFGAGAVGDIATNPWINIAIATIFLVFAFNLFGAFEIQIPASILNKLNTKANSGGRGGLMLMGLVFSLTSFTCTVPFVGTSLIGTAEGEWFLPVIGMLGFSLVFAIPFFLLALFPTLLKKMPKSGGWMNNLKVVMGFVEVAAALKFISNVDLVWALELLSRQTFVAIWIAICIMITLYILGVYLFKLDSPLDRVGGLRVMFAIFFLSVGISFAPGLWNEPLGEIDAFLPPRDYMNEAQAISYSNNSDTGSDLAVWHKTLDEALMKANTLDKNVFVDFTGWTCTNCRLMESNMFPKPQIASKMNQMVKAKLYTDRRKEPELSNKKIMQERFGSIALPLYVIMKPDGTVIDKMEFTRDEDAFEKFLKKGL